VLLHATEATADWIDEPEQSWEASAIALEAEVWASLFDDGVDVMALARRAFAVYRDYVSHTSLRRNSAEDQKRFDEFAAEISAGGPRAAMMFDPEWPYR
jgi:hypothetical protein